MSLSLSQFHVEALIPQTSDTTASGDKTFEEVTKFKLVLYWALTQPDTILRDHLDTDVFREMMMEGNREVRQAVSLRRHQAYQTLI